MCISAVVIASLSRFVADRQRQSQVRQSVVGDLSLGRVEQERQARFRGKKGEETEGEGEVEVEVEEEKQI